MLEELEAADHYHNVGGASKITGLSVSTLNKKRLTGSGPIYSKRGNRVLYSERNLYSWMKEGERRSTSEDAPRVQ